MNSLNNKLSEIKIRMKEAIGLDNLAPIMLETHLLIKIIELQQKAMDERLCAQHSTTDYYCLFCSVNNEIKKLIENIK